MRTKYKYIRFEEMEKTDAFGRTRCYAVMNRRHEEMIGLVEWEGGWRQYTFQPFQHTSFSGSCLRDIDDFIRQAMEELAKGTP